ncbi:MAG: alanine--tRNA ligase [Pseudomonadota bacterium]
MKTLTSRQLREAFLDYFAREQHEVVPSSPLVPGNDPTLLFTNAGMVQFKDLFLGKERRDYVRATSSQRCVRAGGKHNDLENVGYTARHLTFFEMLGNFSFGDYFKQDAIRFAWQFVTEVLEIPAEKLWVTVYKDDDEAADIWINEVGVPADRLSRLGEKDNFWQMGDTGPCGPCSEIFYDHGPEVEGGPPGSPDEDGDRYVEIWNLVFMQFDRDAGGTLTPLPKPSVDTGMGLERVSAVMQGVHTIYDTDMFVRLIEAVATAVGVPASDNASLRVIADHIRACAFLITDGVLPSNEGRGYVLRRIIRRAVRHGYMLGQRDPFFHKLVTALVDEMGAAYPELAKASDHVEKVLEKEEISFAQTIEQGMGLLEGEIAGLDGQELPGELVFRLYDTYGFPRDLTADIARERGLTVDNPGFERAMAEQRERARGASKFGTVEASGLQLTAGQGSVRVSGQVLETDFSGYEKVADAGLAVEALYVDGATVDTLGAGQSGIVVLESTPFYAESGGQVGDTGTLESDAATFAVVDTQKNGKAHLHIGTLESGALKVGDAVHAHVDAARRQAIILNHSATHLMHAALRDVLGEHVAQKGSLVDPDKLRFDFSHYEPVSADELQRIEDLVNDEIRANHSAETREMPYDAAVEAGALALFGEKYEQDVRVLKLGAFSMELCGGTHVARTGDIGLFKITSESGVAAGVRRIEAVTGEGALAEVRRTQQTLSEVAGLVRASRNEAVHKVGQVLERNKALEKELAALKSRLAQGGGNDLSEQARDVGDIRVLSARLDGIDAKSLREAIDRFRDKLGSRSVVVLGAVEDGKVRLAAGVAKALTDQMPAGDLVRHVAEAVGGKGGGRADFAQAGGSQPENLDAALEGVSDWVAARAG